MGNEMIIDLDFAWDFALGDFLIEIEKFNLKIEKFIGEGPGGGNPNIFLKGKREDLIGYLEEFYCSEYPEEIPYYLGEEE